MQRPGKPRHGLLSRELVEACLTWEDFCEIPCEKSSAHLSGMVVHGPPIQTLT
jgi:hypothetical protein